MSSTDSLGRFLAIAKRTVPRPMRPGMLRLFDRATETIEWSLGRRGPLTPPLRIRLHVGPFSDSRLYRSSAQRNLAALREFGDLPPNSVVLDIGCGSGRLASALTSYLAAPGRYEGFDLAEEPIQWCRRSISPGFPNFRFTWMDVASHRYNPEGSRSSTELRFPYEDGSFDFAVASSVYTHLLPDELGTYLRETARVLRPGGVSFATYCLLTERSLPAVSAGRSIPPLPHVRGTCCVRDPADPSSFIAYPEALVRGMMTDAGLRIREPIHYGSWADGSPAANEVAESYCYDQDILVAVKPTG